MKQRFPKRLCAAPDCGKPFTPKYRWEIFHSQTCASRVRQKRLRERQKAAKENVNA